MLKKRRENKMRAFPTCPTTAAAPPDVVRYSRLGRKMVIYYYLGVRRRKARKARRCLPRSRQTKVQNNLERKKADKKYYYQDPTTISCKS